MLVFNTMLLKGNSENGTFSVAVFGVIYTMSTIPGAMFDGAGAAACYGYLHFRRREGLERNDGGVSRWTADCCSSRNDYGIVFCSRGKKHTDILRSE